MVVQFINAESLLFLRKLIGLRNPLVLPIFLVLSRRAKTHGGQVYGPCKKTTKRYLTLEQSVAAIPSVLDAALDIARGLQFIDGAKNRVARPTLWMLNH